MKSEAIVELGKPLQTIETETPTPKGKEVLLKITHSGVCHSDVHIHDGYFDLGGGNKLPVGAMLNLPHTMGHEIEGEVVSIGSDVKDVEQDLMGGKSFKAIRKEKKEKNEDI